MIYTFYSFKGGVGRSMALANVAEYFYRKGLRVVIVDWDLEAPGLESFYFNARDEAGKEVLRKVRSHLGLMDMLMAYKDHYPTLRFPSDDPAQFKNAQSQDESGENESQLELAADIKFLRSTLPPIQTHLYPIHEPGSLTEHPEAGLWLMQAGWREGERFSGYTRAVQGFDWIDFYVEFKGKVFFEWMREELERLCDVILIDSRTGVTEMGGVCTQQLADIVVCCSILNNQNMEGIARMMKSFTREEVLVARDGRPIWNIAVPTRIDTFEIDTRAALFESFKELMGEVPEQFKQANTDYEKLRIPYVSKYAYFERLAIGANDRAYELETAYKTLATHLVLFAPTGSVLRSKLTDDLDQILRVSESPAPRMSPPLPSVFIDRPEELDRLRGMLDFSEDYPSTKTVVVSGRFGYGKSVIAAAFCREPDVVSTYKDGILWVTLGSHPNLKEVFTGLYTKLSGDTRTFATEEEVYRHLVSRMHGKKCLIVVDDLCHVEHLTPFDELKNFGSLLATTRDCDIATRIDVDELQVGPFSNEQALKFISAVSRFPSAQVNALENLVQRLGCQPLLLRLAGDMLRQKIEIVGEEPAAALDYAEKLLSEKGITAFDKPDASDRNQSVARSVGASLDLLSPEELDRYLQLVFMLDVKQMNTTEVAELWREQEINSDNAMQEQMRTEQMLLRFSALSLIEYDSTAKTVKLDGLLRNYLLAQLPSNVALHLKAESIYSKATPDEEATMQRVLPRFVKLGRDPSLDTRTRVRLNTLDDARGMVAKLMEAGILIEDEDKLTKERKVLFADESLIKKWVRLRDWIKADREFLLWMQQIRPSYEAWKADPRYGVLRGEELATASNWMAQRPGLDQALWAYVTVSEETNSRQRWKQVGLVAIVAFLVVAIILVGAWRWYQSREAAQEIQRQKETAERSYRDALAANSRSEFDNAIRLLSQAITYEPNRAEYFNARGNAYSSQQNYNAAISDFDRVIQLDPTSAAAHFNRGLTFQKAGDNDRALSDFNAVLSLTRDPQLIDSTKQQIRDILKVPAGQKEIGWGQYALYSNTSGRFDILNFRKTSGDPGTNPQVNDNLTAVQNVNLREVYVEQDSTGKWIYPPVTDVAQPSQNFTVVEVRAIDGNGTWLKLRRSQAVAGRPGVLYYALRPSAALESAFRREKVEFTYGGPPPVGNVDPAVRYYYDEDRGLAERVRIIIKTTGMVVELNRRADDPRAVSTHSRGAIEVWLERLERREISR